MQLPAVFRPSISIPPMYTWPRSLKRLLLTLLIIGIIGAYLLLGGGIIALLALFAESVSG